MGIHIEQHDLRPGGEFIYRNTGPNDFEVWGKFVYREITPPERLVYTSSFSNPEGETVRGPFSDTFPLEILNVLTFEEMEGTDAGHAARCTGRPVGCRNRDLRVHG